MNELERLKDARLEAMFPDEVDTPRDSLARIRFQKYRGLKSFKTTVWDPKENLPYDYGRIFQFENFLRTKKRVLSEEVSGAEVGWYVKIHVKGVGAHLKPQLEGVCIHSLITYLEYLLISHLRFIWSTHSDDIFHVLHVVCHTLTKMS